VFHSSITEVNKITLVETIHTTERHFGMIWILTLLVINTLRKSTLLERLINHGVNSNKKNGSLTTFTLTTEEISSLLCPTVQTIKHSLHLLQEPSPTVKLFAIFSIQQLIANRLQVERLTSSSKTVKARFTSQVLQAISHPRLLKVKFKHSFNEYSNENLISNILKNLIF
jgi:hypothetical protein